MSPARSGILGEVISKITPNLKKKKKFVQNFSKFLHQIQKLKIIYQIKKARQT